MGSIRLSPRHGVNPAIPKCWYCWEEKNELYLCGILPGDEEAPRAKVWNMEPCDKCKEWMKKGIILISMKDGEGEKIEAERQEHKRQRDLHGRDPRRQPPFIPNPYRSGVFTVATEEAVRRWMKGATLDFALKFRWLLIEDSAWDAIGLPREDSPAQEPPPPAGG